MPRPSKLPQDDRATGLDDEHTDAAVMHGHIQPPSRVALQGSARAVPDNIAMTHQDIYRGGVLTRLGPVEVFPERSLYPGSFLEEICRVRCPALCGRVWDTGCSLPEQVTASLL